MDRRPVPRSPAGRDQQVQSQPPGQARDLGDDRGDDRVPARRLQRPGCLRRAREAPRSHRPGPRHGRQPPLLPGRSTEPLPGDREPSPPRRTRGERGRSRRRREAGLDARDRREALRLRPRIGANAEPRDRRRVRRGPGLSDRPLPRQGDGSEPLGLPLRERALRADLESALHRLGPDHRGRDGRRRGSRRVLRPDRCDARRRAEPRPPAHGDVRDGAARRVRTRGPARREAQGASCRQADGAERRRDERRPRPVRLRLGRGRADHLVSRRPGGRARLARPRPSSRSSSRSTPGAGRGCRSTCAPARRSQAA